ncbi:MAG: hypothetical protein RR923_06870 [Bacilli bacterium]
MNELLEVYKNNELQLSEVEKQISLAIADLQNKANDLQTKNEEIKEKLKLSMEESNTKKYENDYISITYVAPTTRNTVDSAKLKTMHEDIYNECLKVSNVKSSIRIKVKEFAEEQAEIKNEEIKEIEL